MVLGQPLSRERSFSEFLEEINRNTPLNVIPLIGYGALKIYEVGFDKTEPSPEEMDLIEGPGRGQEGVFGFSSGLVCHPGSYGQPAKLT